MRHELATQLVLTGATGDGTVEFSRAVEVGTRETGVTLEAWLLATDVGGGYTAVIDIFVLGSNDLSNWTSLTGTTPLVTISGDTTTPADIEVDTAADPNPYRYVRLKYVFKITGTPGSGDKATIRAAIETFAR